MSNAIRHTLYAVPEVTYGVTPASPSFVFVRHNTPGIGLSKETVESQELRADRQIYGFRHTLRSVAGDVAGDVTYGSYDTFWEAALGGTWAAKFAPYVASTISAAASDNSLNDSANAFPAYQPGDKITVSGFTGAGTTANTTLTVVSRTVSKIVVSGATLVDDAAGESVTVTAVVNRLKTGTTRRSFSFMRYYSDIDSGNKPYHVFSGIEIDTLSIVASPGAIVQMTMGVIGRDAAAPATAAPASSTLGAASTTEPMNAISGTINEGGSAIAVVTELQLESANGLAARPIIGSDKTIQPSQGKSRLTGTLTAYFEDSTLLEKFMNETESSVDLLLADPAGNKYRLVIPRIKYSAADIETGGEESNMISLPFTALYDSTTGTNFAIDRIAA